VEDKHRDFMRIQQCHWSKFADSFARIFYKALLYSLLEIKLSLNGQRLDCSVKGTAMCTRAF
jgi:hypothetical protein